MRICQVEPDRASCSACLETQEMFNVVDDCSKCNLKNRIYELIDFGSSFWGGDYAIVQYDGMVTKVSISRLRYIKETK